MNAVAVPDIGIAAFETGSIDPGKFDHEAHIYLGWLYTQHFPLPEALTRFSAALIRLTEQLGIPGKYHETITWFYLFLIAERRSDGDDDWYSFRRRNADLFERGGQSVLNRYYRRSTLQSERARRGFVLPDRRAR